MLHQETGDTAFQALRHLQPGDRYRPHTSAAEIETYWGFEGVLVILSLRSRTRGASKTLWSWKTRCKEVVDAGQRTVNRVGSASKIVFGR